MKQAGIRQDSITVEHLCYEIRYEKKEIEDRYNIRKGKMDKHDKHK